ncbi:MAG: GNAT family N-acetyltransferase [Actinomycetota bacterium]|nr:GNAT family N-acetyltransferase [Actinomycetota bacterium]
MFCVGKDAVTAQLRILLVDPVARGCGLGRRLAGEGVRFARDVGQQRMVLWTNDPFTTARRIYLAAGFHLLQEERHRSFGVDLVGQSYTLNLHPDEANGAVLW